MTTGRRVSPSPIVREKQGGLPIMPASRGESVVLISRCAWTLFNFRLPLLRSLLDQGHCAGAWGSPGDGYERRLVAEGIDFRGIRLSRRAFAPIADLALLVELIRRFKRHRPSVVHCFTIKPAIYGTLAAWIAKVPVKVVTITGLGHVFTSGRPMLRFVVTGLYRLALARADFVFFQNEEDRRLFAELGLVKLERTSVVAGSGVDVERFSPAPLPTGQSDGVGPKFLMIARLLREKGVLEYVAAAEQVKRSYSTAEFVLVGGEDPRNPSALLLAEIGAIRKSTCVHWVGAVDDVRPFIEGADVVVLPSYREGLPRVLLEAGSMGRPVIATDVTGCRNVVVNEVTGYLVPPKDAFAIAEAMKRFCRDRASIGQMGKAARTHIVGGYDEKAVIRATLERYKLLLSVRNENASSTFSA